MKKACRNYPRFALCGLNCGLCPMYHISEDNHCTGCGVEGRPSCAVLRCARAHGGVEYCFQCPEYPCRQFQELHTYESFIASRNVEQDFARAKAGSLASYQAVLDEKVELLRHLIRNYNDGRRKSFFCLAVNLLDLEDVRAVVARLDQEVGQDTPLRERALQAAACFQELAAARGVTLKLQKKPK